MYKKYKDNYIYPAIIEKCKNNYGAYFYDIPGCVAVAESLEEVISLAKESLALHLWDIEHDKKDIPKATAIDKVKVKPQEIICLIDINMFAIRSQMDSRAIKKTLTIPWYLNELATKKKINFSQLLQAALKEKLGLL